MSHNVTADPIQLDVHLQQLSEAANSHHQHSQGQRISSSTLTADESGAHNGSISPEALHTSSSSQSGDSTPQPGDSTPHSGESPQRPRMQTTGSSVIQIRKETKKSLSSYPRKGYKTTTKYFYQEIDSSWTAVMLVACFFTAGLIDAISFAVWGVFASMQTGYVQCDVICGSTAS